MLDIVLLSEIFVYIIITISLMTACKNKKSKSSRSAEAAPSVQSLLSPSIPKSRTFKTIRIFNSYSSNPNTVMAPAPTAARVPENREKEGKTEKSLNSAFDEKFFENKSAGTSEVV